MKAKEFGCPINKSMTSNSHNISTSNKKTASENKNESIVEFVKTHTKP